MKLTAALLLLFGVPTITRGQPPLPPQERPRVVGTVINASERDGVVLEGGQAAPLAKGVELHGVSGIGELAPGDLVELIPDENGLVRRLSVLPRLAQRRPLAEVISGNTPVCFFWWQHEGNDFPGSIYAADATVPLLVPAVALEATVAYTPAGGELPVTFAVLDPKGAVLWEAQVAPGETTQLQCALSQTGTVTLRCRRSDGSVPDHTHCIWGSPSVLLRELGSVPLDPRVAAEIAEALAKALGVIDPGAIGVARPRVVGLSENMAIDLQHDLLVALGSRYEVAGLSSFSLGVDLSGYDPRATQDLGADTMAAAELRYGPEGSVARVALISADGREVLAQTETAIKP